MIPNPEGKQLFFLRLVLFTLLSFFIITVLITNYILAQEKKLADRVFPNVYIDKINVGNKTKKEVEQIFANKYSALKDASFTIVYQDQPVATLSGAKISLEPNINEVVDRAYLIGRVDRASSRVRQKITSLFNLGRFDFHTIIAYNKGVVEDFTNSMEQQYNKPAKDALFTFSDNRVTAFKQEEKGNQIESAQFLTDFDKAVTELKNKPVNSILRLKNKVIEPEVTLSKANQFGIEEEIGEGQSNYSHSIPGRIHNVLLAAKRINGVLIPKGEEFSFNNYVGEISKLTGYDQAYVIKEGKTVLDDGGGVCQVSTTLFRAALNTGLPITARTAHAYRVGYYENDSKPGFDATVFAPYVDFRFKNDTSEAILIQTEIDEVNQILKFKLYGKKDGRVAQISNYKMWDVQPPLPDVHQDDPTLKKGEVKQVDFPAWGSKVSFDYTVTKNNQVNFAKNFYSNFKPWQAVYLVGTAD